MRLLLISNDYPPKPGGIQQYLGNLLDAYPGPVRVLAPNDGPATTGRGEDVVVRHPSRFMWPTPAVGDWVIEQAGAFAPDAVLFGAPYPLPWLGPRVQATLGVPVGVLCHGAEVTLPAAFPGSRHGLRRILAAADVRFAVSRFTVGRVERLTNRPVHYVGAGVDLEAFHPAASRPDNRVPVVACVSRFVPRKGQDLVIDAAGMLASRGRPIQVLLVGKGRTETQLRRKAERTGVDVRFEVDVPWERLPGLYREADIFCMPCRSRWGGLEIEGLGLVFLEAAASGLPVLAGDSGGAAETVVPGRTGFIVRDAADIAEGIELLVSDPVRAAAMGASGRRRMEAEFTWDAVVGRLVAGFESAAHRGVAGA